MADGDWKVTVSGTDYENTAFTDIQVKGRENGISSATLVCSNLLGAMWNDTLSLFDSVQVAVEDAGSYVEIFDGYLHDYTATLSDTGALATIKCHGLGSALKVTHCKDMFGYTSNQDSLNTIEEILEDLVDNSVNKSYSSANVTGYAIGKDYIQAIDAGLSIPFVNAPYQTCEELVNIICRLDTAYRDGSTAGPHYFTDVAGNLRIKTIGTQQAHGGFGGGDWGIYYGGSNVAVALTEGVDFFDYVMTKPASNYANNVVVVADLRKPAYDYWTEDSGGAALWGNDGLTSITDDNRADVDPGAPVTPAFVVGSHGLTMDPNGAVTGYAYYPSGAAAEWNIESWGSEESIPTVNFYCLHYNLTTATTYIYMSNNDTARKTDYYYATFLDWTADPNYEWKHCSLPIGPYWKSAVDERDFRWTASGTPVWTDIDTVEFMTTAAGADGFLIIDDLHFSGKIIREAVDTSEVTSYNEYQHAIISRTPLDDTAVAATDTGMAGQLAHAELLRRVSPPRYLICTVPLQVHLKPGEYYSIYAGKTASSYKINGVDFRCTEYTHRINEQGRITSLKLTDDVLNSFPLTALDVRKTLNEYLLENNAKATDMQGGDVDLLVPHLRKTY
jgi:hypothetical protein